MSYHYTRLLIDPISDTKTNIKTKDRFFEGCSKVKKCEAVFQWIVEGKIHPRQWLQFNKIDMPSMSVEIEKISRNWLFSLYLCSDEGSSLGNSHINISAGFSGLASKILPLMPTDGALTFEIIIFGFMFVSLLLQYLNLYRSVWWLPHSYNNNAVVRWN